MSDSGDSRWRDRFVLWRPVLGLAAVQGSITLSWVIYRTYLPKLLTQLGFPEVLAARLLLIELILAIALEPLMGGLSDRVRYWVGSRFPFISLGVILSSALFIAIPASVAVGNLNSTVRWILPSLAVAWALAMTIFRSPVMVLLSQYAAPPELPRAASVLVLVGGTLGAIAPFSSQFLLSLGPGITFATGSIILLVAVKVLRSLHPPEPPSSPATDTAVPFTSLLLGLMSIVGVSLGLSWGFRFLSVALSQSIIIPLPEVNLKIFTSIVSLVVAIGAIPAGIVGSRWGNSRTILIGIAATVSFLLLMGFVPYSMAIVLAIVGLIAAFSLVNNSAIPFIFGAIPPHRIGLGIGTYFGSSGAASSLFNPLFGSLSTQASTQATYSAIAFLIAGISVAFNALRVRRY
jgi:MFS family permease